MTMRRCAIYTRKSTEEGLDQEFNSLDAQREACAAFILSQRHEGWRESRERFDDGGFSGGSMDRPALARLLGEVEAGRIEVVVVYKVDRLTRSLTDFAKMVEIFDAAGASFVSVTQQFNTTTSMGRLTLNVLLSFAQFEREVAAERIRDKIAASKRKGMWMGGVPPLGYDVQEKALAVNAAEAETVRLIFRQYLELGSVRALKASLDDAGIVSKRRVSRAGRVTDGVRFTRGALYAILRNPLYIGEIAHRGERHRGRHDGIVDRDLWQAAQSSLDGANGGGSKHRSPHHRPRLLDGLLFDEHGRPVKPTSASRRTAGAGGHKTYRYYASRRDPGDQRAATRLPAEKLDDFARNTIASHLADVAWVAGALRDAGAIAAQIAEGVAAASMRAEEVRAARASEELGDLIERIDLAHGVILVSVRPGAIVGDPAGLTSVVIKQKLERAQPGRARPIVLGGATEIPRRDPVLIALIADARRWARALAEGEVPSVQAITANEDLGKGAVSRVLPLAYLAPDIVESILEGRQPPGLTAKRLRGLPDLPLDCAEQRRLLGFAPA
jgi:DNA invertase Pin-like site-specific DNA recombinase